MLQQRIGTSQNEENRLDEAGIPPIQLHHIGLKTARFEEMRAFYHTFLDVHPVLEVDGFGGFYTFDLAHHRLALFDDPICTEQVPTSAGMHHVAFLYSLDDLIVIIPISLQSAQGYASNFFCNVLLPLSFRIMSLCIKDAKYPSSRQWEDTLLG
jgi:hypothetical protein